MNEKTPTRKGLFFYRMNLRVSLSTASGTAYLDFNASRVPASNLIGPEVTAVECCGVERSGVELSGVEWSGVEWSGVEWSGVERS
jgi:hypothetical protein